MLATNTPLFNEIDALPLVLDPARLEDAGDIEATRRRNGAKYHMIFRLAFNNIKLDRAKKRRSASFGNETEGWHAKQRWTSHDGQTCIMCEKTSLESDFRQVITMTLDKRLHECAETMNDGALLTKLGGEDAMAQELNYHRACLTVLYNREQSHLIRIKKDLLPTTHTKEEPNAYPLVGIDQLYD